MKIDIIRFIILFSSLCFVLTNSIFAQNFNFKYVSSPYSNSVKLNTTSIVDNEIIALGGSAGSISKKTSLLCYDLESQGLINNIDLFADSYFIHKDLFRMDDKSVTLLQNSNSDSVTLLSTCLIMNFDSSLNSSWAKKIILNGSLLWMDGIGLVQRSQGFDLIASTENDVLIHAFADFKGNLLSSKKIDFDGIHYFKFIGAKMNVFDNSTMVFGNTQPSQSNPNPEVVLVNIDSIGDLNWAKKYKTEFPITIYNTLPLPNGDIFLLGYLIDDATQAMIMKADQSGTIRWVKTIPLGTNSWVNDMSIINDSTVVFPVNVYSVQLNVNQPFSTHIVTMTVNGELLSSQQLFPFKDISYNSNSLNYHASSGGLVSFGQGVGADGKSYLSYFHSDLKGLSENKCCIDTSLIEINDVSAVFEEIPIGSNSEVYEIKAIDVSIRTEQAEIQLSSFCDSLEANFEYINTVDSSCYGECLYVEVKNKTNNVKYFWDYSLLGENKTQDSSSILFCNNFPELIKLVANRNGCTSSREIEIPFREVENITFPNAFTPDGDSINEVFRPISYTDCPFVDYHLQIYNRWGNLVFESRDFTQGWDGRMPDGQLAASDVYIYKALFSADIQGEVISLRKQGEVHLLR